MFAEGLEDDEEGLKAVVEGVDKVGEGSGRVVGGVGGNGESVDDDAIRGLLQQ